MASRATEGIELSKDLVLPADAVTQTFAFLARRGAATGTGFRYLPKRMVSWVVAESQVESLVKAIMEANRTGQIGDGKIFVLPLDGITQIPTGESGVETLHTAENAFGNA